MLRTPHFRLSASYFPFPTYGFPCILLSEYFLLPTFYSRPCAFYSFSLPLPFLLQVEQMLTTGGGWQDQAGGLLPGVKRCSSLAVLPLAVESAILPVPQVPSRVPLAPCTFVPPPPPPFPCAVLLFPAPCSVSCVFFFFFASRVCRANEPISFPNISQPNPTPHYREVSICSMHIFNSFTPGRLDSLATCCRKLGM